MSRRSIIILAGLILLAVVAGLTVVVLPMLGQRKVSSARAAEPGLTPLATPTDLPPTPTETLPPTPELPTPQPITSAPLVWIDVPTDQSSPGYDFRVSYDGSLWALTTDDTGAPALLNRQIPYCKIAHASGGRGLPRGWTVDDQFRDIGSIRYEVITASQNNVVQFINYFGGDGNILTGFQVSFQEQNDNCIQMAETVLASLTSVAAPPPSPTPELPPSATP